MIGTLNVVLAMKPLIGSFVDNARSHGVAGLNIDGSRIDSPKGNGVWGTSNQTIQTDRKFNASPNMQEYRSVQHVDGRFPSNVILGHLKGCQCVEVNKTDHEGKETIEVWNCEDGCPVSIMDQQSGDTSSTRASGNVNNPKRGGATTPAWGMSDGRETHDFRDTGGASRFFKQVSEI